MKKVTIGKYTLESLTTGMYVEPYVLYREYVQNSADSIDKAIESGLIDNSDDRIDIYISKDNRTIEIIDNGTGIESERAYGVLADIGNSKKKSSSNKGFRGIGRLSGLGYCEKLIFETSTSGENKKSIITFDSNILHELLSPGKYEELSLEDVILKSSKVEFENEENERHYLKVKMINVNNKLNLLEFDKLLSYLQQTLPVPYNLESFTLGNKINNELHKLNQRIDEYNIYLHSDDSTVQVLKPYRNKLIVDIKKKILDEVTDLELKLIVNDIKGDKPIALVWYGRCGLKGTIVDDSVKGLRIRKAGLLIGDRFLANPIFNEDRFNGWVIGEIIVLDDELIPNARRDDFEKNDAYLFFMKELRKIGEKISNEIRIASTKRNINLNDSANKKKSTDGSKNIFKEIDYLLSNIVPNSNFKQRIRDVLIKYKIDSAVIDNILKDLF